MPLNFGWRVSVAEKGGGVGFLFARGEEVGPVEKKPPRQDGSLNSPGVSLQLLVLRFSFLQDGDVGVGIFPEREEISVGGECPDTGGIGFRALRGPRLQSVGTRFAQMRQRSCPAVPDNTAVIENLLKLGSGRTALSGCQVCLAPDVRRIETGTAEVGRKGDYSKLDRWESNL